MWQNHGTANFLKQKISVYKAFESKVRILLRSHKIPLKLSGISVFVRLVFVSIAQLNRASRFPIGTVEGSNPSAFN